MADSTAPVITEQDYHPDRPAQTGWLIYSLHTRLMAIEQKLGLPTPGQVVTEAKSVAAKVEADAASLIHRLEDMLHISHG